MSRINLYLILFLAFLIRLGYSVLIHPPGSFVHSDIAIYLRIADAINAGQWSPEHFVQPVGYPLLLVLIKKSAANWSLLLAILQSLASSLTLYFVWKSVLMYWGDRLARWALLVGMIHLPWIVYTGYSMAETFYTMVLAILLWASCQLLKAKKKGIGWALLWGFSFVVAFWLKGQHVLLLPLFLTGILLTQRKSLLKMALPIVSIVGMGILLHGALTFHTTGITKFSGSTGGLNFVEGKCPSKKNTDTTGLTWWSPLYHSLNLTTHKKWDKPFSDSAYFYKQGLECIQQDPWVMIQSLEHISYLFFGNPLWPTNWEKIGPIVRLYEVIFPFFMIPGLLIFVYTIFRSKAYQEAIIWLFPVLALFMLVYIFKSEIRYRIPFDIFFIPIALRGWFIIGEAMEAVVLKTKGEHDH